MTSKFSITLSLLCLVSASAFATKCRCKQHAADAEANGTCSRTEDEKLCTLTFTATPPQEYEQFKSRLKELGLTDDPHDILRQAYEKAPDTYSDKDKFITDDLPILFAISQREEHFQPRTKEILEVIRANKLEIQKVFTSPDFKYKSKDGKIGQFDAVISYGCIELSAGKFSSMVKTRWAGSNKLCNDFPK
jgi:hypothetical protein